MLGVVAFGVAVVAVVAFGVTSGVTAFGVASFAPVALAMSRGRV